MSKYQSILWRALFVATAISANIIMLSITTGLTATTPQPTFSELRRVALDIPNVRASAISIPYATDPATPDALDLRPTPALMANFTFMDPTSATIGTAGIVAGFVATDHLATDTTTPAIARTAPDPAAAATTETASDTTADAPASTSTVTSTTTDATTPVDTATAASNPSASGAPDPSSSATNSEFVPLDIPLDPDVQRRIYEDVCERDSEKFAMLMAVAAKETDESFATDGLGDQGRSFGLFQVQPRWHRWRMEKYNIATNEELFDPVKCAYVALDYLESIKADYDTSDLIPEIYIVYNAGHYIGTAKFRQKGAVVMEYYNAYLTEFKSANPSLT